MPAHLGKRQKRPAHLGKRQKRPVQLGQRWGQCNCDKDEPVHLGRADQSHLTKVPLSKFNRQKLNHEESTLTTSTKTPPCDPVTDSRCPERVFLRSLSVFIFFLLQFFFPLIQFLPLTRVFFFTFDSIILLATSLKKKIPLSISYTHQAQ